MKKYRFNPQKFNNFKILLLKCFGYISIVVSVFIGSLFFYSHLSSFSTVPNFGTSVNGFMDFINKLF